MATEAKSSQTEVQQARSERIARELSFVNEALGEIQAGVRVLVGHANGGDPEFQQIHSALKVVREANEAAQDAVLRQLTQRPVVATEPEPKAPVTKTRRTSKDEAVSMLLDILGVPKGMGVDIIKVPCNRPDCVSCNGMAPGTKPAPTA